MQVSGGGDEGSGSKSALGGSTTSLLQARRTIGGNSQLSEINVTPFVDVVLVLLIIFMITAPMLTRSMDIRIPTATTRQPGSDAPTVVSIDGQGRTFVNNRAVNIELLEEEIRQRVEVQGLEIAYLRADEALQYGQIIRVMDLLKRAGITTVGLAYQYPEEAN